MGSARRVQVALAILAVAGGCTGGVAGQPPDAASDVVPDVAPDARASDAPSPDAGTLRYPVDGRFREEDWNQVRRLTAWHPLPASPTNRFADDPRAAALGRRLFEDPSFSADGRVACATCHDPARSFTDGRPVAEALGRGTRNTPSILYAGYFAWQMWDGVADSLWAQPILAVENPREHGFSRLALAHRLASAYRAEYEAVFGPLPALEDAARFPTAGRPGDGPWEAMRAEDRDAVNRVAANFGKAIEAFERALPAPRSAFDRYAAGEWSALSPRAKDGAVLFVRLGCVHCHSGALLSDDNFHSIRAPDDAMGGPDPGRIDAVPRVLTSEFNADGPYSDAPGGRHGDLRAVPSDVGRFRTPTLRGVARTAPYTHAGTLATLADVVRHDARQGLDPGDPRSLGAVEPDLLPRVEVSDDEVAALVAFLEALNPE